jgi:hypothetical protein
MIPQELSLLEDLLQRLAAVHGVQKDPQADALIRARLAAQPDALYLLVQRTLLLEHALDDARRELARRAAMPADPGGAAFLQRGLEPGFGRNAVDPDAYDPGAAAYRGAPPASTATTTGAAPPTAPAPGTAPAQGWRERFFGAAPAPSPVAGGGPGLLGQAATTAAGVAGGMFLFNGIEHLMGRNQGGAGGGGFLGLGGNGGNGGNGGIGSGNPTGTTEVVENVTQNFYDGAGASTGDGGSDDGRRRLADDAGADWPGFDDGGSFNDDDDRSV